MKKKNRVCKNHEFSQIISRRRFAKSQGFVLYYRPSKESEARVGISVGKKLGNAVVRNRVKRQVREMTDRCWSFKEGYDTVLIVRPGFLEHSFSENLSDLEKTKMQAEKRMRKETR